MSEKLPSRPPKPNSNETQSTLPASYQEIERERAEQAERPSNSYQAVTMLLASLSQTFRFDTDVAKAQHGYHLALDMLTPEQIRLAGTRAILRHKFKTMPQPAQLREWALEEDEKETLLGFSQPRTVAGGVWNHDPYIDENGYEFYRRR